MSDGRGNILQLNIQNKCGEKNDSQCRCGSGISNIKAKEETSIDGITNFTKRTHYLQSGGRSTFKLNRILASNGGQIGSGKPIEDVESVSVYYWSSAPGTLIMLGITTKDVKKNNTITKYYSKGTSFWINGLLSGKSELGALDQQNCQNNNAIPFNIQDSQTGSIPNDSNSSCINTRRINSTTSPPPPGSNYTVKAYLIKGINGGDLDTKISRVTYKNNPTDISTPGEAVEKIRLYSYQGSGLVPLMIEFVLKDGSGSKWYEGKDQDGRSWIEVGGSKSDNFYIGNDNSIPTSVLSEKLDEILCKRYNNVTLNLSHTNTSGKYCCEEHGGTKGAGKVTVSEGSLKVKGEDNPSTKYHKHTISSGSLGGIYYTDEGRARRKVELSGSPFPISGIQSVYTFYCQMKNPVLIYLCGKSPYKGWYKKGVGDQWTWIGGIHNIKPDSFNNLDCRQWMKLRIVLEGCSCTGLSECSTPGKSSEQLKRELEKEMQEEEKIAEEERGKEIEESKKLSASGPGHASVSGPPSNAGSLQGSESSESGGSSGVGSGSPSRSSTSSPTGDAGPQGPTGSEVGAERDSGGTSQSGDGAGKTVSEQIQNPVSPSPKTQQHDSSGQVTTTQGGGGSHSASNKPILSSPKGSPGLSTPAVGPGRAGVGVTIKLDSRDYYKSDLTGGDTINVIPYTDPPSPDGYDAHEHVIGKNLKINKFTIGGKKQIFLPGVTSAQDLKKVVVYFFICGNSGIPLLLYFKDKDGRKWYENKGYGIWQISGQLSKSPSRSKGLEIILKSITKSLGLYCKGNKKTGANILQRRVGHSQHIKSTIPPPISPKQLQNFVQDPQAYNGILDPQLQETSGSSPQATPTLPPPAGSSDPATPASTTVSAKDPAVTSPPASPPPEGSPVSQQSEAGSVPVDTSKDGEDGSTEEPESPPLTEVSASTTTPAEAPKAASAPIPPPEGDNPETARFLGFIPATAAGIGSAFGVSSGTLAGSAATFFGGWKLYNRYKGDPWVRQI
ncbi:hypothetical protein BEWA_004530 [Theileria equi strain WA]|uniref:Uncharacterized protein n=1 Tax=Theileria equi strain WA TaxID=1537102 RepID=L0AZQ2_THEEQ|nr:hypothetical protein BEWA_004530 [Theileria equi strain WA]AFZ81045.1 hypothetical protein BEWA_004530 [Theileria equi strain WA]|eukprot:XP_004830711.1 hypothetical protein BEWA_004530 [Theileria equi strain WA]